MSIDLASLSLEERRELHAQLAYEFRGSKAGGAEVKDELWDTLNDALKSNGRARQPFGRFLESFGKARYQACSEQLEALIVRAVPNGTRRPIVMSVRRMILECLITHLTNRGIPATPASVLNSFAMLKHSVDLAFPGYIEAQLLDRVAVAVQAA